MNHNIKMINIANNCDFLKDLEDKGADYGIRNKLLNAILNRKQSKTTQKEASELINVSKRTISDIEQMRVSNITTILEYIYHFSKDNAIDNRVKSYRRLMSK